MLGSPWWLFRYVTCDRFREGLVERFFGPSAAFASEPAAGPRIWIHAVSVGEVLAISGLVGELQRRAPQVSLVVSTTTRTGQKLAQERFGNIIERCFYFPLDFPWSVRAAFEKLKPSILVLAESELWPNVLSICREKNIPVVVVNARVSDRSLPRYLRLRALWRPFLQMLSQLLAQTEEDARRFRLIGVPAACVTVGGNLKFDVRAPQHAPVVDRLRGALRDGTKLLVCGSTLEGEESLLLEAWSAILKKTPNAVMLLAPRHPERFERVAELLQTSTFAWVRRSTWNANPSHIQAGSIFLLDSIGELASLYALAAVAFVGGSLVPGGGHNPLEPAQFGVPVATGPHYENFRDMVELLLAQDAIRIVHADSLEGELIALLRDESVAQESGQNARRIFEAQAGATRRAAEVILSVVAAREQR